jgi:hypothetical protein
MLVCLFVHCLLSPEVIGNGVVDVVVGNSEGVLAVVPGNGSVFLDHRY